MSLVHGKCSGDFLLLQEQQQQQQNRENKKREREREKLENETNDRAEIMADE